MRVGFRGWAGNAARAVLGSLTVVVALAGSGGVARAAPIPEGTALWFACTEPSFTGPLSLRCPFPYDPRYLQTFLAGFARFTPENEFKMAYLEPLQDHFNFAVADQVAAFARAHGKTIRGHTLIYGKQLPWWVQHPLFHWTAGLLSSVMQRYISTVVGHFAAAFPGVVSEWDVVNEPLNGDGTLAPTPWMRAIGPAYIRLALGFAHQADPSARLVINENGAEVGPKADGLLELATSLKESGAPLDAIGFESHVNPDTAPSLGYLVSLWRRYAAVGLDVEVTELDVGDDGDVDDPAAKLAVFRRYAEACRLAGNCTGFTVWGVADRYSWLGAFSGALLYGLNFAPTAAARIVHQILQGPRLGPAPAGATPGRRHQVSGARRGSRSRSARRTSRAASRARSRRPARSP